MAIDILRMDSNPQYASHYGTASDYGPFHGYNPYALQTQMHAHRGPRQTHGPSYFGGYGRQHHYPLKSSSFNHGGAGGSKRKFQELQGQPQGVPSLHQLRADNLKKTRRHFQGPHEVAATPRTAPRAPDNRHGFLLSAGSGALPSQGPLPGALHAVTPSAVPGGEPWKNSYGNADKEAVQLAAAAGLDFLGSFYDDGAGNAADENFDLGDREHDVDDKGSAMADTAGVDGEQCAPPHTFDEEASFPPQAKRKLASQAAYIAQLEEQALSLRERIFLLETQLEEARRLRSGASPSGQSGDTDDTSDEATTSSH